MVTWLRPDVCERALGAHDARFDGLFFVGITTTRVYCRPVCPSRAAASSHRRFFDSAASAEGAGFRPCLRCRPELAPGKALCDAVPRLARVAAQRIAAGALNGRGVADLARDLGVSERHLRRALEHEIGVSPLELAQTHRLLLAKRLLADTTLPVTRIAYASGFQSLRRFNSVFRERYRLSPSAVRRRPRTAPRPLGGGDFVRLTLAYRSPFAWELLLTQLSRDTLPGVETIDAATARYARTLRQSGETGVIRVADDAARAHLEVDVSPSLLPALMPLLARLRHMFDLDAEPLAVDAHLEQGGLGALVRRRPGVRIPGTVDGFEAVLRVVVGGRPTAAPVIATLGESIESAAPGLTRLTPTAARVADAGARGLERIGVPSRRAAVLAAAARAITEGTVRLEPGTDVAAARAALLEIEGLGKRLATMIVMRALNWPDAFPPSDPALRARAEQWRPWRAYAALQLWLEDGAA